MSKAAQLQTVLDAAGKYSANVRQSLGVQQCEDSPESDRIDAAIAAIKTHADAIEQRATAVVPAGASPPDIQSGLVRRDRVFSAFGRLIATLTTDLESELVELSDLSPEWIAETCKVALEEAIAEDPLLPIIGRERAIADDLVAASRKSIYHPISGPYETRRGAYYEVATRVAGTDEMTGHRFRVEIMLIGDLGFVRGS